MYVSRNSMSADSDTDTDADTNRYLVIDINGIFHDVSCIIEMRDHVENLKFSERRELRRQNMWHFTGDEVKLY